MTGYKTYTDGEVLVADDLNDYLQQGVLRYATKAARDADLTTNAREGMVAYSTSDNVVSWYDGSGWSDLTQAAIGDAVVSTSATGSATIDGVDYDYWTYTSSGNFVVTTAGFVTVLCVAGGGGATAGNGHGGGAGGVNFQQNVYLPAGTATVVVGAGGQGVTDISYYSNPSFNGTASRVGEYVVAVGGGGNSISHGRVGGSGGGGLLTAGAGTPGQGNSGGDAPLNARAGGGGAGQVGGNGVANTSGGDGGDGLQYNMNGTATYYGGGGGAGANGDIGATPGSGGVGGGGNGSNTTAAGQSGTANTGGGGGGGGISGGSGYYAGNGGSGIVIIRVPQ